MQEHNQIPTESRCNFVSSSENVKFIQYKGPSMNPTLQDLDVLYYVPDKQVRLGDVVIIKIPEYKDKVIHRVISASKKGIKTRGDFNSHPDNWLLKPDQIIGSVAYGYRGKKKFSVHGGLAGLIQMYKVRLKCSSIKITYPILCRVYHNFPTSISSLIVLFIQPRPVIFKRPNGVEMHLLTRGNKVIGRRLPGQKWQIKSPYKFFIDESNLPN